MKAAKIFTGILQLPIAVFIVFQTYSAWSQIITTDSVQKIVYSAFAIAVCYLIAGVINLATNDAKTFVPDSIYFIFLLIGWIVARNHHTDFGFLNLWAWVGLFLGIAFLVWHIIQISFFPAKEKKPVRDNSSTSRGQRQSQSVPTHYPNTTQQSMPYQNNYNTPYTPQTMGNVHTQTRTTRSTESLPSRAQMRGKKGRRSRRS